ncbi:hypothetical protein [Aureitalea marina]|uniref:Secretion system C-terminal sorting domain-containing protein n=1 Tax=Aureitalea marina TaxID=930804 RepID=A0A2S7KPJ6_9FLAO|nr:hypothetical protein [Aureitalea marina]PQB04527.1 hypothetical protein BST85_06140 [Aureitalea marina]
MKTVKRILVALAVTCTLAMNANTERVITSKEGEVTITEDRQMVQLSVLNTQESNYTLVIYAPNGQQMYEGELGSANSIGQQFDFTNSVNGTYTFVLTSDAGAVNTYKIKTGFRF